MNKAEIELLDGIEKIANKYGMNSRTLNKILEAEVQRIKDAFEGHPELLPEQWFDEPHEKYEDFRPSKQPFPFY